MRPRRWLLASAAMPEATRQAIIAASEVHVSAARRDPFDRLIAATARRRNWTLVTRDPGFAELAVSTLWLA